MQWLLLAALVAAVTAVDRSKFRTCAQTSFCTRNRGADPAHKFKLGPMTVAADGSRLTADLLPQGHARHHTHVQPLDFEVTVFATKAARVRITEKQGGARSPIMVRWENPDVILPDQPLCQALSVTNDHAMSKVLCGGDPVLSVDHDAFRIDLLHPDGTVVASANARGLFYFEQQRGKQDGTATATAEATKEEEREIVDWGEDGKPIYADGSADDEEDEEADAGAAAEPVAAESYTERFGSHTDTRPHGPMSVGMDISFPGAAHVYGVPEHATDMALKSTRGSGAPYSEPYRLYTLDVFEYELDNPMALYGAIPVMLAHGMSDGVPRTAGVFWHNPSEAFIDVEDSSGDGKATQWMSESGIVDLFLFRGPSPTDFFSAYSALTGTQALPPLFAVAYHQCRWNYRDEKDVETVDAKFEELNFPYDVLWLDIEHTDGKRYFTWDKDKFPQPAQMQEKLAARGHKMVTIVDPHIKRDNGFSLHSEATAQGLYIKNKDGADFDGWCWPGSSSYLDFTTKKVRDFWAGWFSFSKYKGSTKSLHTWNDMNEPSVFNGPEVSMPKDAKNLAGVEHREWHNMYGFYQHMATVQGLESRAEQNEQNERGFVLSRSFFAGSQRWGAIWTGDNAAEWSHLKIATPMLLTQGLAGYPFAGADMGGFFGNPDTELLVRWYQAAAYQPFFRAHAHIDTKRREPWLFGATTLQLTRAAVLWRYALLPYVYTVFEESSRVGLPIMRALWLEFPSDAQTFAMDDQFLLGDALLIHPVTQRGVSSVQVYLPGGPSEVWYDVDDLYAAAGGQRVTVKTPLSKLPVFQRGGTIVPRKRRVRRASAQMLNDPYTLTVALDKAGSAQGELYMDDTRSFAFRRGVFARRVFKWSGSTTAGGRASLACSAAAVGTYSAQNTVERVEVLGVSAEPMKVVLNSPLADSMEPQELGFAYDDAKKALVIRKPGVQVASDFELSVVF